MRKEYRMSQEQFDELMNASEPTPMIMLQCGSPPSPQEKANRIWEKMGKEMGFKPFTVRASARGSDQFTFSAEEE